MWGDIEVWGVIYYISIVWRGVTCGGPEEPSRSAVGSWRDPTTDLLQSNLRKQRVGEVRDRFRLEPVTYDD